MYFDYPIPNVYGMIVEGLHRDKFLSGFANLAKDGSYGISQRQMDGFVKTYKGTLNGRKYRNENDIQLFVGLYLVGKRELFGHKRAKKRQEIARKNLIVRKITPTQ